MFVILHKIAFQQCIDRCVYNHQGVHGRRENKIIKCFKLHYRRNLSDLKLIRIVPEVQAVYILFVGINIH